MAEKKNVEDKKVEDNIDGSDWKRQPSGLYTPPGTPPSGKKQAVGFARALLER